MTTAASNVQTFHTNGAFASPIYEITCLLDLAASLAVAGVICMSTIQGTLWGTLDFNSLSDIWSGGIFGTTPTAGNAGMAKRSLQALRPKQITIVIPCRAGSQPQNTLASLSHQTYRDFDVVISYDRGRGANWARNRGLRLVRTPFVLFSDDDIEWCPTALERLKASLDAHPEASYSYGSYVIPGVGTRSNVRFDPARLRRMNYISTMSLVRTAHFPGFDESIKRLQDWDVWLTMLEKGEKGVHCGSYIFKTHLRRGITFGDRVSWNHANQTVRRKHGLPQV